MSAAQRLPEALWAQILSHMDVSQNKIRLQLVCRMWRSLLTTPLAYNSSPLIIDREPWIGDLLSRKVLQALPSLDLCFANTEPSDYRDLEPLTHELRNLRELQIGSQMLSTQHCEMLAGITYLAVSHYTSNNEQELLVDQLGRLAAAGCSLKRLDINISGFYFSNFDFHEFLSQACDLHLRVDHTVFMAISKSVAMRLITFENYYVPEQWKEEEEVDRYLPDLSCCTRLVRVKIAVLDWPRLQPDLQQAIRHRLPSSHKLTESDSGIEFCMQPIVGATNMLQ